MVRVLLTIGVLLVLAAGLAAAVGVLAYGTEPPRDGTLEVAGLAEPVRLGWGADGTVWVEGADAEALAAYVDGEMAPADKHRISHRADAFRKLVAACFGA